MSKVKLIDLSADWCGPCRIQDPIIDEVERKFKGKIEVIRVNIDQNKELTRKYKVMSIPTIILECDGKEKERFIGLTQELFLKRAVEKALKECR